MNKALNFQIFRFHLLPLSNSSQQLELFEEEKEYTSEEIKEKKNEILAKILNDVNYYNDKRYPVKIEHNEDGYYFIKLAQKKTTKIVQDFKNIVVENEPFVYIFINNDNTVQKIAISDNKDAFTSPTVVKNILKDILASGLKKYGLNIEIEELFKANNFWKLISKHQYELQQLDFKFIKPNLASISPALPEDFKRFSESVNSHESHIVLKAPKNGILENISKKNRNIDGLVNYTSEGAGNIKVKIKGVTKRISTKESPVIIKIREASITGPAEQVFKAYQDLISK
ncbi:hypothetical protein CMU30_17095 [Elizabethkingia anophelis]|nr:hypothetical protein [Elizabethkingia anophelis]MDV3683574.1 hypothetical protein [Elizabethkingia anophelis]MDV3702405.1 hypothetical protein [Elizabethkingia anophelis]MDV3761455.1 hypothetical protein [Elizabethkingia anophelis]MDV3803267.1 hypothetical protein [Elizabethkingia anophelis]